MGFFGDYVKHVQLQYQLVCHVKTVKEKTFHKRSTNVPISKRNETKTFEFVPKFGPGEQILDQIETICFQ
jgi:hypothetical protein